MKQTRLVLAACAILGIAPAMAATPDAASLPGHYYLQGVTEVGSELLLKKEGKFE